VEAEYIAAADTISDLIWLKNLLQNLEISCEPSIVNCDPQSAIKLIWSLELTRRAKNFDVKYHLIRDYYAKKVFRVEYVKSEENAGWDLGSLL